MTFEKNRVIQTLEKLEEHCEDTRCIGCEYDNKDMHCSYIYFREHNSKGYESMLKYLEIAKAMGLCFGSPRAFIISMLEANA